MQRLSTSSTYFYKIILPILYFTVFLGLSILMLSFNIAFVGVLSFLIAATIFSLVFLRFFYGIKKVSIDPQFLYVSNFKEEIKIPFSEIDAVTENVWILPRKITVRLNKPSSFGKRIDFLGYYQPFIFFKTHPAVEEIRARMTTNSVTKNNP